jgi:hypothetical protein
MIIGAALLRWMYRGGRPNRLARVLNRISAAQFGSGRLAPATWVTLEVTGRRSGRTITCPVVVTVYRGERPSRRSHLTLRRPVTSVPSQRS